MTPTFVTWLWNARGGWRHNAGYSPAIIQGVQHMLQKAVPGCRVVCVADEEYESELTQRGVEWFPLWSTHGQERTSSHGFDCHARLGLYGQPGLELADYLGTDVVQWLDADVMIQPRALETLTTKWDTQPEMYWVPRGNEHLDGNFAFGKNAGTWLGVNASMVRLRLGSRPDWWQALASPAWIAETEARICGSDQAALTRLLLEDMGEQWQTGNQAIMRVPSFDKARVVPYGMQPGQWDVAFFPYDPYTAAGNLSNWTKPWLTKNAYLAQEWRVLNGMASEAEVRAQGNPLMQRVLRRS